MRNHARTFTEACELMPGFRVHVECYAGYRGDEDVRRFYIGRTPIAVVRTLDRWAGVDHRYFKVVGEDGGIYILRQDMVRDVWELTQYQRPT